MGSIRHIQDKFREIYPELIWRYQPKFEEISILLTNDEMVERLAYCHNVLPQMIIATNKGLYSIEGRPYIDSLRLQPIGSYAEVLEIRYTNIRWWSRRSGRLWIKTSYSAEGAGVHWIGDGTQRLVRVGFLDKRQSQNLYDYVTGCMSEKAHGRFA